MAKVGNSLAGAARSAFRLDRSKVSVEGGIRTATGIAIPLAVGQLSGHTVSGVTAAIGALTAGFASLQGTYRSRAGVVLAATVAMAASAFLGATVGHLLGADIVVTGALGFAAGLLVCLGQSALVIGVQAVVGMVVFSQFTFSAEVAARDAGLVLLGGLVQMLLVVVVWPFRRFPAERKALGDAYAALGRYCEAVTGSEAPLMEAAAFDGLYQIQRDPQPFGGDETAVFRALVAEAERIRLELVSLARARQRAKAAGRQAAVEGADGLLSAAGSVLTELGLSIREARVPARWEEARDRFESCLGSLRSPPPGMSGADRAALTVLSRRGDALAGQIRTAMRLATVPAGGDPSVLERTALTGSTPVLNLEPRRTRARLAETVATLRSNLALTSQAFRHAVRLAVTLGVAVALSHAFSLDHRYWLPMTAMIVLRPDFGSTVSRGLARVLGTLVGAGLVTVLLALIRPGPAWLSVLVVLLCFAATTLIQANYTVYSVLIASLVVTLLAFTGQPEVSTAGSRSFYTVIGAALAMVMYLVWPTWEATSLPDTLAGLMEIEADYASSVIGAWADPAHADRPGLQRLRMNARLARSNAEAAVGRWEGEPGRGNRLGTLDVPAVMAALRTCVQGVLALHAELPRNGFAAPRSLSMAEGVQTQFHRIAASFRGQRPTASPPPLRQMHVELARELGLSRPAASEPSRDEAAVTLASETDLIVDAVNTMAYLTGAASVGKAM